VEGFTEDNTHDRYRDLDLLRYDLDLKGFMIRPCPSTRRSGAGSVPRPSDPVFQRPSLPRRHEPVPHQGLREIHRGHRGPSVAEDVRALRDVVAPAGRIVAAMDKMAAR
jgi:hypothetical protein